MMKFKWTSSNKNLIKFLVALLIMGILIGIYIYIKQPSLIKVSIINELKLLDNTLKTTHQNNFLYHILIISVFTFLSILVLGVPIILFYLFYEGVSMGFLIAGLFNYKKVSGLIYGVIFMTINKLILYVLLVYLLIVSINYSKKVIISIRRKDYRIYEYIFTHLVKMVFILIVIIVYDIFIYFLGNKILAYFTFLL